jgi:radial spoke head protein 9
MQLEMGLTQLRHSILADEVMYWGKINGINADYYIAVAVTFRN